MKLNKFAIITILACISGMPAMAQSWVTKAAKSVCTLNTFDAEGKLLGNSICCFAGGQGECIGSFGPFVGASSAVIIDGSGNKYNVSNIICADATYNICRFLCEDAQKTTPLKVAAQPGKKDDIVYVLPYALKKPKALQATVSETQQVKTASVAEQASVTYYTLNVKLSEKADASPLFNEEGELLGITQYWSDMIPGAYAADVNIVLTQQPSAFQNTVLSTTSIPALLPSDPESALVALFMMGSLSEEIYQRTVKQFIKQFPTAPDGYVSRAQHDAGRIISGEVATQELLSGIQGDIEHALDYSSRSAQVLCDASRIELQLALHDSLPEPFTFEHSLALIDEAIQKDKQALFFYQKAHVLLGLEKWRDAVISMGEYETMMPSEALDAQFYYQRYQAELNCKMYQQAIDDIQKAIDKNSHVPLFFVEQAQLLYRLGKFDDAEKAAENAIASDATLPQGFLLLGAIQMHKGNNTEAKKNLQTALEKGAKEAQALLDQIK